MRQATSLTDDDQALPPSGTIADQVHRATAFLRRRYLGILICFALCLPFGAAYYVLAHRSYTASAMMLIESQKSLLPELENTTTLHDSAWVESQLGVLKSQGVAAYVVKQLRLAEDQQFLRSNQGPLDKVWARFGWDDGVPKTEAERVGLATALVMGGLQIHRSGLSYMIQIDYRAADPEVAVKVANAMVDAYIYDQLNAKYQANRRAGDWLQERLQTLREQAATAERAVIEYRAKNNIVKTGGTLINEKELSDTSGRLATVRARIADLESRLNRIEQVRDAYQEDRPVSTPDQTVSEEMASPIINQLRSHYLELVNREADWTARYGKNHQAVVNVRNQIRDMRRSIRDELGRIEQTMKSDLEIAKKQEQDADKALANLISQSTATNQAQVRLFSLESTAQSYRKLYDNFLQRHTETVQQQTLPMTDARMLSTAGITRASPQLMSVSLMTILAGGMVGVGFGLLREMRDRGFRTRDQVRSLLGVECLSLVPILPKKTFRALRSPELVGPALQNSTAESLTIAQRVHKRARRQDGRIWQHVVDAPTSAGAEAIRSLKMTLDLNRDSAAKHAIGITSCLPGEGKSTIAAAMAATVARTGLRVILIDCDLRNPSLSRSLAPDARVGFFDVVSGRVAAQEAIWRDPVSSFDFLPAVLDQASLLQTDVLTSGAAGCFFDELKKEYDCVLVDLPPLMAGVDVRATVRHLSSNVLVVEWGGTKVDEVEYALRHAPEFRENMAGVVLNKVDMKAMGLYDSYGARYYYGRPRHSTH